MATLYFTNNNDSGDGSFRATWASMTRGDVIEPDPEVFAGEVVEIIISNYLATPATGTYTVRKGSAKRFILNGQDSKYFFTISRADLNITFEGVDFVHGKRAQNAPFAGTKFGSLTFRGCGFYNNFGGTCGFLRVNTSVASSVTIENCVAYGNKNSTSSGQVLDVASETTTATLKGCTFGQNYAADKPDVTFEVDGNATVVDSLLAQDVDFSTVGFVDLANCDFRLTPASSYLTGATSFVSGDVDFLGNARKSGGAIGAYEGSWLVVKENNSATVDESLAVDQLELETGSTLVFDGSELILRAKEGAAIGEATIQSSDPAYLVIPDRSAAASATITGVSICEYGAGLLSFSVAASSNNFVLSWTVTDSTHGVLVERMVEGAWTPLDFVTGTTQKTVSAPSGMSQYRVFDGETFLSQGIMSMRGLQYQALTDVKPYWEYVEVHDWKTEIFLVRVSDMNENIKTGQAVSVLARIYDAFDNDSPLLNDGTNISSVYYTCEKKTKGLYNLEYTPVEGHDNVLVDSSCVLTALQNDDAWDADNIGYNFILTPNIRQHVLFATVGSYRIRVTINLVEGNPITFYKEINVTE